MADLVLPVGAKVKAVEVITPEITEGVDVKYTVRDGRLRFELPGFLVYSIARVKLQKE